MRIFTSEIRKIFSLKTLLVLVLALAVNWILLDFSVSQNYPQYGPQPEDYRNIVSDLAGKTEPEKLEFLAQAAEQINACQWLEMQAVSLHEGTGLEFTPEQLSLMEKYREAYESKSYLVYTDSAQAEYLLIQSLYQQAMALSQYDQELDRIITQAQTKSAMPVFAKPGTFIYRNLLDTAAQYQTMYGTQSTFDVSQGVTLATENVPTDIIVVLFLLFISGELILREKEKGILPVIKSTWKGRLPVITAKILVIFGLSIVCSLLFFGENLIYSSFTFGLGDLSRSIQSLDGYLTSWLKLSVGEYLLYYWAMKMAAYFLAGMLSMLVCVLLYHPALSYLCTAGVVGVSYVLYSVISPVSAWNLLKYLNFANMLSVTPMFKTYRNLNLFGWPVPMLTCVAWLIAVVLAVCVCVSVWLFCCKQTAEHSLRLPRFLRLHKPLRLGKSVSVLYHESFKLLRENRAVLLLAVFLLIQLAAQQGPVSFSTDDIYYKSYMNALTGEVGETAAQYIEKEQKLFADAEQAMAEISQKVAAGEIDAAAGGMLTQKYQAILAPRPVFERRILPQYEYLLQQQALGKSPSFVYDAGYRYLMGQPREEMAPENQADIQNASLLILFMVLCFSGLFAMEYQTGLHNIISVYKKGRKVTALRKIAVSVIFTVLLFLVAYLPDFLYVMKYYSLPEMGAALCSLPQFGHWPGGWKIWHYFVLLYSLRLLTCLCILGLIQLLSCKMRSFAAALCVSAGLILSPFLLHLLGVQWLDWFSFLLPLSGNLLWVEHGQELWWLLYYGLALLVGAAAFAMLCKFPHVFREHKYKSKKENA